MSEPVRERAAVASKLAVPRVAQAIDRRRLVDALSAAPSLVWLAAPAGAGKTLALAKYCAGAAQPTIWYRCGPEDCDASNLVAQLSVALSRETYVEPPRLIASTEESLRVEVERIFSKVLAAGGEALLLVLDDAHLAQQSWQFRAALAGLIAAWLPLAPTDARLVVCSRERPPASFTRLKLDGSLYVLEAELLVVDEEEAAALLGISTPPAEGSPGRARVHELLQSSRGWTIAAAALARDAGRRLDVGKSLQDYISIELMASLPDDLRRAVRVLAWLPDVGKADLEALQYDFSLTALVSELERAGVPFQEESHTLRLHDLVRDAARQDIEPALGDIGPLGAHLLRRLVDRGCFHEATTVAAALSLHETYATLLERDALTLAEGRELAIEHALSVLPRSLLEARPWLLYLQACCVQSRQPAEAQPLFERALEGFRGTDTEGERACAAALTIVTLFIGQDFRTTERWSSLLGDASWHGPPSLVDLMALAALLAKQVYTECSSPNALRTARRAMSLLGLPLPAREALWISTHCCTVFLHANQQDEARIAHQLGREVHERARLDAAVQCAFSFAQIYYSMSLGDFSGMVQAAEQGIEVAESTEAPFLFNLAHAGAFGAFLLGDAERLTRLTSITERVALLHPSPWYMGARSLLRGWIRHDAGDLQGAQEEFAQTVEHATRLGFDLGTFHGELGNAFTQIELGRFDAAERSLERATAWMVKLHASAFEGSVSLARAYLRLTMQDARAARDEVEQALSQCGRLRGIMSPISGTIIRRLLVAAHAEGVAPSTARTVQQQFRLAPPREDVGPQWLWPLSVRSLGEFGVERAGVPVETECPASSLALFKILLAAEGAPIEIDRTSNLLWRGSKSKRAAFDTALHRLRRYLGFEDLVSVRAGRLQLDASRVWVDAWALEHLQPTLADSARELASMEAKLMALYRGPFCDGDPWPPVAQARARYARTFGRAILQLARGWCARGELARSLELVRHGLADPHLPAEERRELESMLLGARPCSGCA